MRALTAIVLAFATAVAAGERVLVDEVVAVVDTHSITLSELVAETRVRLALEHGPRAAAMQPDRPLLAAALRRTVEERVVLAELERLKLFDLDHLELEALLARLRAVFPSAAAYAAFVRSVELTEEEIGAILARELRVARYLDNRLKLAAQVRDNEIAGAAREQTLSSAAREALRDRLAREKYQRLLQDLLADLRRRTTVRVLDPLEPAATAEAR